MRRVGQRDAGREVFLLCLIERLAVLGTGQYKTHRTGKRLRQPLVGQHAPLDEPVLQVERGRHLVSIRFFDRRRQPILQPGADGQRPAHAPGVVDVELKLVRAIVADHRRAKRLHLAIESIVVSHIGKSDRTEQVHRRRAEGRAEAGRKVRRLQARARTGEIGISYRTKRKCRGEVGRLVMDDAGHAAKLDLVPALGQGQVFGELVNGNDARQAAGGGAERRKPPEANIGRI